LPNWRPKYKARIADREILVKGEIEKAVDNGEYKAMAVIGEANGQRSAKPFRPSLKEKKVKIRNGTK